MRHRWGTYGVELVLAVVMANTLAGWLGMGAGKVMAGGSGFERASYSTGPGVSANFILGANRAPGMMTAGWSVCWRSVGERERQVPGY